MSNEFLLAKANAEANFGPIELGGTPTAAQIGSLAAHEVLGRATNLGTWISRERVDDLKSRGGQLCQPGLVPDGLGDLLDDWSRPEQQELIGFWLTMVRNAGISREETLRLTALLVGDSWNQPAWVGVPSVRRYPTGGISEKQALILPALLRALAPEFDFVSPFLVARRLAHTGGTRDKLSILPGFSPKSGSTLGTWTGGGPPVRYITADADLCPRDEVLYFLRGQTGTVVDVGLIAASICAKQHVARATCTIIDVLYGELAFFSTHDQAREFGDLASEVANALDDNLVMAYRPTSRVAWRAIGSSVELCEAISQIKGDDTEFERSEVALAGEFAVKLLTALGHSESFVTRRCQEVLSDREQFASALASLWCEHGVDAALARRIIDSPEEVLLGELQPTVVRAPATGIVACDATQRLADIVNSRINTYVQREKLPEVSARGGLMLGCPLGDRVESGDPLFTLYTDRSSAASVTEEILQILHVVDDSGVVHHAFS